MRTHEGFPQDKRYLESWIRDEDVWRSSPDSTPLNSLHLKFLRAAWGPGWRNPPLTLQLQLLHMSSSRVLTQLAHIVGIPADTRCSLVPSCRKEMPILKLREDDNNRGSRIMQMLCCFYLEVFLGNFTRGSWWGDSLRRQRNWIVQEPQTGCESEVREEDLHFLFRWKNHFPCTVNLIIRRVIIESCSWCVSSFEASHSKTWNWNFNFSNKLVSLSCLVPATLFSVLEHVFFVYSLDVWYRGSSVWTWAWYKYCFSLLIFPRKLLRNWY